MGQKDRDDMQHVVAEPPQKWMFDKRIPILTLVTVLISTVTAVLAVLYWVAKQDTMLDGVQVTVDQHADRIAAIEAGGHELAERMVRIETLVEQILQANVDTRNLLRDYLNRKEDRK